MYRLGGVETKGKLMERKDLKVGVEYVVVGDTTFHCFDIGELVQLRRDDGSASPYFASTATGRSSDVYLRDLEVATPLAIAKCRLADTQEAYDIANAAHTKAIEEYNKAYQEANSKITEEDLKFPLAVSLRGAGDSPRVLIRTEEYAVTAYESAFDGLSRTGEFRSWTMERLLSYLNLTYKKEPTNA